MRTFLFKFFLLSIFSAYSWGEELIPAEFQQIPYLSLPISVGKSSYKFMQVSSSKYASKFSTAKNEKYYEAMSALHENMLEDKRTDIFSIGSEHWVKNKSEENTAHSWHVSRLHCDDKFDCFLFGSSGAVWLVVEKSGEVFDFQLVNAIRFTYGGDGSSTGPDMEMDTFFGDGIGFYPYPETHYDKTGIFCSTIVTKPNGEEKYQVFKRRITPEGKLESKALPDGVTECKDPW